MWCGGSVVARPWVRFRMVNVTAASSSSEVRKSSGRAPGPLGSAGRGTTRGGEAIGGTSWGGQSRGEQNGAGGRRPARLHVWARPSRRKPACVGGSREQSGRGKEISVDASRKGPPSSMPSQAAVPSLPHGSHLESVFPSRTPRDPLQRDVRALLKGKVGGVASWLRCAPLTQAACFPDHSLMTSGFLF